MIQITRNIISKLQPIILLVILIQLTYISPHSVFAGDVQEPAVAGSFYTSDPEKLEKMVDGFINNADPEPINGEITALILPHAGYIYSGWVAGYGIKTIKDKDFDTVIIVGPSHRFPFKGLSVLKKDFYETPLGNVAIDKDISKKLIRYSKYIIDYEVPFKMEHSAEVEIPFIQRVLPNAKIVVMLTGDFSYETVNLLRNALSKIIRKTDKKILLVASTDLSHHNPDRVARQIDSQTLALIDTFDPEMLFARCSSLGNKERPCGAIPVIGVMMAARELGANELKILKYATSGDVTDDRSQVVGYVSAVMYRKTLLDSARDREDRRQKTDKERENAMEGLLNDVQKKKLLEIAKAAINSYIKEGKTLEFKEDDPVLNKEMGAFVTLHKKGTGLRGCIGNIEGKGPLYLTVRDMAIASATQDSRFPMVSKEELDDIEIEISVLSELEKVDDPSTIVMGKHGVIIKSGYRSGVFLPQVATETGWDRETFLSNLCSHKAGIPSDAWKKGECEIYVFTAEVFK